MGNMFSLFSSIIDNINSWNIGAVAIISLIALATKELAMSKITRFNTNAGKYLNAAIIIMLALFLYLLANSITKILSAVT